ncbi:MAG: SRPBCC domain-containing protein [Nitrososphaeraceae archaeon]
MELKFEVYAKIKKPIDEVFDAVYNPKKLSGYFTTGGATGPLDEGKEVTWDFHDFPGARPVQVKQTVKNEKIVLQWAGPNTGKTLMVEMKFEILDKDSTLVKIRESGWSKEDQESLDESYGNCMGWMQMLCCLKVYVGYGKNLREFMF